MKIRLRKVVSMMRRTSTRFSNSRKTIRLKFPLRLASGARNSGRLFPDQPSRIRLRLQQRDTERCILGNEIRMAFVQPR